MLLIYDPNSLSLCSFSFSKYILQSLRKKPHMTIESSFYRRVSCRNPAVAFSLHARQCHVEKMALP